MLSGMKTINWRYGMWDKCKVPYCQHGQDRPNASPFCAAPHSILQHGGSCWGAIKAGHLIPLDLHLSYYWSNPDFPSLPNECTILNFIIFLIHFVHSPTGQPNCQLKLGKRTALMLKDHVHISTKAFVVFLWHLGTNLKHVKDVILAVIWTNVDDETGVNSLWNVSTFLLYPRRWIDLWCVLTVLNR